MEANISETKASQILFRHWVPKAMFWQWRQKLLLCYGALQTFPGLQDSQAGCAPHSFWGAIHPDADVNSAAIV